MELYKLPVESKKEANKDPKVFKEKFSSIKFPVDLEVKLRDDFESLPRTPIGFLVKKNGAPNEVSVIGLIGEHGKDSMEWEVMASVEGSGLDGDSIQYMDIDDTEDLIKAIEKNLYYNPSEDTWRREEEEKNDESLEFNPSRYRENEFRTEYAEMLINASDDKEKNREIIDDIMEMKNLLENYYYVPEDEVYPDLDPKYINKLNILRQKYSLPQLYKFEGRLSQYENK